MAEIETIEGDSGGVDIYGWCFEYLILPRRSSYPHPHLPRVASNPYPRLNSSAVPFFLFSVATISGVTSCLSARSAWALCKRNGVC
jgi:hypothetical protein